MKTLLSQIESEFDEMFPNDNEFCCCDREYCYPTSCHDYAPLIKLKSFISKSNRAVIERVVEMIDQYLSYYNPIGDERNKGKHIALTDLKSALLAE